MLQLECLAILHQYGTHHDSPTIRLRQTPAHMASLSGKMSCLKWLVDLGIAINRQVSLRILTKFLQKINMVQLSYYLQQDYLNETVLHKVARGGNAQCARFLLLHGADKS